MTPFEYALPALIGSFVLCPLRRLPRPPTSRRPTPSRDAPACDRARRGAGQHGRRLRPRVPAEPQLQPRSGAVDLERDRPLLRAGLHGARLPDGAVARRRAAAARGAGQGRLLPLGGVPARPPARQQPARDRTDRDRRRGAHRVRRRPRRAAPAGGRARPRQRRTRAPRGVLHRLARHDGRAQHRLRHPLRVRHLPSDLRRRAAGRAARRLARTTARRGSSRTPRPRRPSPSAATPRSTTTGESRARAGSRRGACRRCPTTTWCRATRTAASTRCACGAP